MANLSSRLKELRKEKGKLQSDIAALLGISLPAYNHYELGTSEPGVANLIKLANYYNVTIDYLVGQSDSKKGNDTILSLADKDRVAIETLIDSLKEKNKK